MQSLEIRQRIMVKGVVQGVGFRPYVHNLALQHGLRGFVRNSCGAVEIEVQGEAESVESFVERLTLQSPPLAQILNVEIENCPPLLQIGSFQIIESVATAEQKNEIFVPPDTATCNDCIAELFTATNRRFGYPFINCTNCGPRFTIIEKLPYDRSATTMKKFRMCKLCSQEYDDHNDRRFHAQPNACFECGPRLSFHAADRSQALYSNQALDAAITALRADQVVAVKGVGGFHFLGNATCLNVIDAIRRHKGRIDKPLAVMFRSTDEVEKVCYLSKAEKALLESPERPIVLLRLRKECNLPTAIAPGLDELGAMLAYTPVHHLLTRALEFPLICTSANSKGLPIVSNNNDALEKFQCMGILDNDRDIHSSYDDSIARISTGAKRVVRRARGLAPAQLRLPLRARLSVLALGGHLKNTFCLAYDLQARVSQHMGNISTIERLEHLQNTLDLYCDLFKVKPELLACDLHPEYQTTLLAKELAQKKEIDLVQVQHHHAHAVAVMAEHGIEEALCFIFDGTGLGTDGNVWGGEFLNCSWQSFERLGHLEYVRMPGGDLASSTPWRMALAHISKSKKESDYESFTRELERLYGAKEIAGVRSQIESGLNSPLTSSCGRLFDAVAAIISPYSRNSYEGQAAQELEALARTCSCKDVKPFLFAVEKRNGQLIVDTSSIVWSLNESLKQNLPKECAARAFHETLKQLIVAIVDAALPTLSHRNICFSGGVFQNTLLSSMVRDCLQKQGLKVFFPSLLPANDGGLSFGQAVIALAKLDLDWAHLS